MIFSVTDVTEVLMDLPAPAPSSHLRMRLHATVHAAVDALMTEESLSEDSLLKLKVWKEKYGDLQFNDLPLHDADAREEASLALCFLLVDVLAPYDLDDKWVDDFYIFFENSLAATLPQGEFLDKFLQEYGDAIDEEEFDEEEWIAKQLSNIRCCFQMQLQQLQAANDSFSSDLHERFDRLKQRLLDLNSRCDEMTEQMHAEMDFLTAKVEEVAKILDTHILNTEQVLDKWRCQQHTFERIAFECGQVIRRV